MNKALTVLLGAVFLVASASADTLRLKSGSTVEGTFLGGNSREVEFLSSSGSVSKYSVDSVAEISFGDAVSAPARSVSAPRPVTSPRNRASAGVSGKAIPAGTPLVVRTIDSIDSDITGVGERFRASLEEGVIVDGVEVAPRGADAILEVAKVDDAGSLRGREAVALELVALMVDGREYAVNTNYAEIEGDGKTMKTAKRAGVGAAAGAIIGAIAGGGKGAAIGAGVGAGAGTVYSATKGEKVQIPSETLLTFSLREDLNM